MTFSRLVPFACAAVLAAFASITIQPSLASAQCLPDTCEDESNCSPIPCDGEAYSASGFDGASGEVKISYSQGEGDVLAAQLLETFVPGWPQGYVPPQQGHDANMCASPVCEQ